MTTLPENFTLPKPEEPERVNPWELHTLEQGDRRTESAGYRWLGQKSAPRWQAYPSGVPDPE
jgi:hypothetical protein